MKNKWIAQQRGNAFGHWIFYQLLKIIGRDWATSLLYPVTCYYRFTSAAAVQSSKKYLKKIRHYWSQEKKLTVFRHLLNFAESLLDRAAIFTNTGGQFTFDFDGEEYIQTAIATGRGVILVSAHVGNWEIAGYCLQERLSVPIKVAMFNYNNNIHSSYLQQHKNQQRDVIVLKEDEMERRIDLVF